MHDYQTRLIELAMARGVLRFGEFTLKSGRISPYFFNAGLFNTGAALAELGGCYAAAAASAGVDFDMLFGPAYKGIPLVSVTAAALADQHGRDLPYAFNRKEAKDHGEGGNLVGAGLEGNILVIDDVITAGTAIRESVDIIGAAGATLAGVVIALDRQERGTGQQSAIQEIEASYGITVASIIKLADLLDYLREQPGQDEAVARIEAYRETYGI